LFVFVSAPVSNCVFALTSGIVGYTLGVSFAGISAWLRFLLIGGNGGTLLPFELLSSLAGC
jgi:hypothetical protein